MSKLVNLSDKVYKELSNMKNGRSFSEVILELIVLKKRGNKEEIMKFFGSNIVDIKAINDLKKGWKRWTREYA